jgi:hypothetical protein
MIEKCIKIFIVITLLLNGMVVNIQAKVHLQNKQTKKIYLSFIVHGNMNYDRYVKPTIWRDFPVIYDNFLDFMDEYPDFKGQIQFSGQTFNSLKQTAPEVINHAIRLNKKGQLNFTGTFYSEPVNINMDGETNLRCARLGTSIIEDALGFTDGFYLQERAYHAQLPYILNHSNVSWVPVIMGDDTYSPFKMKGLDGSVTVCVPISNRDIIVDLIQKAPEGSLLLIEDDFEIPQSFSENFEKINSFLKNNSDIEVEWTTVKDYINKFGVDDVRFVDHSSKGKDINHGTYSRWTADPLDIIVQDYTNKAMIAFRDATIMNSIAESILRKRIDEPFANAKITLNHDPLIWNIEQADLYPEVENRFLKRNGKTTILSKAEHLLLWAVNSDAKGWYPLYERRRERINSFVNSASLSEEIINRGLEVIAENIGVSGYDKYLIAFNSLNERVKSVKFETNSPFEVYDYSTGNKIETYTVLTGGKYVTEIQTSFPAFGYKVLGLRKSLSYSKVVWNEGQEISNSKITLKATEEKIVLNAQGNRIEIALDSFQIKALTEMTAGVGDENWRNAKPYGKTRFYTTENLFPQLKIEKQIDWLVHMQQIFTLLPDRVLCEICFTFPHPTLLRKQGVVKGNTFNPEGLTLKFNSGKPGKVYYDIPFAITQNQLTGLNYFCPLSSGIFQFDSGAGYMVTTNTGEQAFYSIPENGEMGIFVGASTTSGPIRDVGMEFVCKTNVKHEPAWYAEPFHGTYQHQFMILPFNGTWNENHLNDAIKNYTNGVYIREFFPTLSEKGIAAQNSFLSIDQPGVEITSIETSKEGVNIRLNEKEGRAIDCTINFDGKTKKVALAAHGIVDVNIIQ